MRERPMRKCARSHNLVPVSLSGGVCDFVSVSAEIINSAVDGPAHAPRPRDPEVDAPGSGPEGTTDADGETHPAQQRYLEVINELCRRYVGYLMWAHEPCKSGPGRHIILEISTWLPHGRFGHISLSQSMTAEYVYEKLYVVCLMNSFQMLRCNCLRPTYMTQRDMRLVI